MDNSNEDEYDIAIIGLGPAGATFARLLDRRYKVIAFDKKDESDKSFKKPCGGLLAQDAQKYFARFGMTLPLDVLVSPQIFSVKTIDLKRRYLRHYQRFYINMDRHRFDLWLKSLLQENIKRHDGISCTHIEEKDDSYLISVNEDGVKKTYRAKYLVAADGANSLCRRSLFKNHSINTYMSIQQWFIDEHKEPFYSCIFDKELTDCYAWGLTKNEYFIFGGAFPLKDARERFEKLKEKLKAFHFKLDKPIKTEACLVLSPKSPFEFCTGRKNCFLLGEAAGFISPSSLEGLSYAFESAYILSRIFNHKIEPTAKDYHRATFKIRLKLTLKMLKRPFIMGPFLRRLIMRTGIGSLNMANDIQKDE